MQKYLFRLTVREITPPISRLVVVRDSLSLSTFHRIIQICMDWYDYHLHEFTKDGIHYAPPDEEDDFRDVPPQSTSRRLSTVFREPGETALYEYDFGDGWEIDITLVDVAPTNAAEPKAVCADARRAGPLEDSGGPYGYEEKLRILANPRHPDFAEIRRWVPQWFDPELPDTDYINNQLERI